MLVNINKLVCLCVNLANEVCAVGLDDLMVLVSGRGVVDQWQTDQILSKLSAEGRFACHTVTRQNKITLYVILQTREL